MNKISLYLGVSAVALTLAAPAFAASNEDIQNRVDDLEATIDALRAEIAEIRKTPEFKPSPVFTNSKGDYAFKFRGQIAADAAFFDNKTGANDFSSGTQLRRARLGIDGTIQSDWLYRLEIDVGSASRDDSATGEVDVKDAYVQWKGIEKTVITIGQHKTPNTLQQAYSSTDTLFVENPLFVEAFTNRTTAGGDYKAGISAKYSDVNWTATAGVFGENFAINGGGNSGGTATPVYKDEGWGPAARLTWAPVNGVDKTLHLGVSGYWRDTGGRTSGVRFRSGPEVSVDSTRLVDTGNIATKNYSFAGAELAGQYGPFYFESEYGRTDVSRIAGDDVSFDGGYAGASWVITGESRDYKDGAFARIKPKKSFSLTNGTWGAWEVAARYSTLDLNDANIAGGKEDNYSVGLNWYPNPYLRLLVDYIHFDATKGLAKDEGDAIVSRVAVIW
ncbi:MAG: OprO/OprP family phosphate-selective porin [Parvibaculum sp.]|uniref:OprO/OprP family phosphate-selective porin n=1 Tax=Parvibaculum sp. TaxID=2024848 RepID=UPI0025FCA746|nr:porin [Parvibaculum sp.]MCE9648623.1 OprO/OprP family phosphate-selective porin [Parvibaculum sp.]